MTDPLIVLIIAILAALTGALAAHLYHRITANDLGEALAEAERLIAGLSRDKELLEREFTYINSTRDKQLLGLAEQIDLLEAETEKLRAGVRGREK